MQIAMSRFDNKFRWGLEQAQYTWPEIKELLAKTKALIPPECTTIPEELFQVKENIFFIAGEQRWTVPNTRKQVLNDPSLLLNIFQIGMTKAIPEAEPVPAKSADSLSFVDLDKKREAAEKYFANELKEQRAKLKELVKMGKNQISPSNDSIIPVPRIPAKTILRDVFRLAEIVSGTPAIVTTTANPPTLAL